MKPFSAALVVVFLSVSCLADVRQARRHRAVEYEIVTRLPVVATQEEINARDAALMDRVMLWSLNHEDDPDGAVEIQIEQIEIQAWQDQRISMDDWLDRYPNRRRTRAALDLLLANLNRIIARKDEAVQRVLATHRERQIQTRINGVQGSLILG